MLVLVSFAAAAGPSAGLAEPVSAWGFPDLDPAHQRLETLPAYPGAPAVVLVKRGELRLAPPGSPLPSTLDVAVRIKVLTVAGKAYGQVALGHGPGLELVGFEGRTIRADGTVIAVPEAAVFRQDLGGARASASVAFPAVEVGAVVDYRFRLAWGAPVFPQTWTFDDRIPTLRSELVYDQPPGIELRHHLRDTGRARFEVEENALAGGGRRVTIRLENAPPVPDEPYGFPFADLAHAAWIVTERVAVGSDSRPLHADWGAVVAGFQPGYDSARRFSRQAQRQARRLAAGAAPAAAAAAIFRFVQAEVEVADAGLVARAETTVDAVLRQRRGNSAEVALLLAAMLEAADIPSSLVWAADWRDGMPWLEVTRPGWFSKVLVRATVGGRSVDLDPSDRRLPAGRLAPVNEGTDALLLDAAGPRVISLAQTPADASTRHAEVDFALDSGGRLSARGSLVLTGHHAWYFLRRRDSAEKTAEGWRQWLADRFAGFAVEMPEVVEQVDPQRVAIAWSMHQHAADVLGDEVTLMPGLPLGPIEQRYSLAPADRQTPVRVSFADRDELIVHLAWPPGWQLELMPAALDDVTPAGGAAAAVEVDETARQLTYRRALWIGGTVFFPGAEYGGLRELYAAMERHDAQPIVLYRDE